MEIASWALRLLGAFYALAACLGLRRCAMDLLLSRAISALGGADSPETRAETRRAMVQAAQLVLVGLGGIALMALLDLAFPIFVASAAFYVFYVLLLAPRLLDPFDPPDAEGLAQRRRALVIYLAVTLLVGMAALQGLLRDWRAESWQVLGLVALLALGLLGYALHLLRGLPKAPGRDAASDVSPQQAPWPSTARGPEQDERLRGARFILSPSWNEGGLFEAETRRPVSSDLPQDMLTEADWDAIQYWMDVFRDVGDAADPRRCGFTAPDGAARMAAEGQWVFDQLAARLGPGRLSFEPVPWPRLSRHRATAVKLMAEAGVGALWVSDGDIHEPVDPRDFGLSWKLELDIHVWDLDFEEGARWEDADGAPRWGPAEAAAHEAEGRAIAARLARELAVTGRAHVPVRFWSESEARLIDIPAG